WFRRRDADFGQEKTAAPGLWRLILRRPRQPHGCAVALSASRAHGHVAGSGRPHHHAGVRAGAEELAVLQLGMPWNPLPRCAGYRGAYLRSRQLQFAALGLHRRRVDGKLDRRKAGPVAGTDGALDAVGQSAVGREIPAWQLLPAWSALR